MRGRLLGLMLAITIARAQNAPVAETLRNRSLSERLVHANTDERIRAYEEILGSAPGSPPMQMELVSAYLQKVRESGDYSYLDRASRIVEMIREKDNASTTALHFENEIDMQRHNFAQVAERAGAMTKYEPSEPGNWANLGDASMELGEYDRAGQAYARMFALRPDLASYNRLAYHRFVTGHADAAIALMRQATEAGSAMVENTAWCWAELGDMYFKTGNITEARKSYSIALQLFPHLHRALAGLGRIQASQGQTETAITSYLRAQAIVPLVEYAGALEDLYTAAGMKDKARAQRDLIGAIDKLGKANNEKTNRNLAIIFADHDRNLDRALELVEAELPLRGDVYTWDAFSWVLFKNKNYQEARAASVKALRLGTPEPSFYYHANRIAIALGNEKAATDYLIRMRSLNSSFDFGKGQPATVSSGR